MVNKIKLKFAIRACCLEDSETRQLLHSYVKKREQKELVEQGLLNKKKEGMIIEQGSQTKKAKMRSTAEYQEVVTSMLTQLQDDFCQFMTKQDAFDNILLSDADKKNERAKLQFCLVIAKAMGNMEEMKELMEEAKRL